MVNNVIKRNVLTNFKVESPWDLEEILCEEGRSINKSCFYIFISVGIKTDIEAHRVLNVTSSYTCIGSKTFIRLRLRFIADTLPISLLRLAYEYSTEKTYSGHQPSQLSQNTLHHVRRVYLYCHHPTNV